MLREGLDVVAVTGDMVLHGADDADWQRFFAVTRELLATVPYYPAVGNHDVGWGGARDNADLTLLNLAAPLNDGQQILVPKKGAATASVPGSTGGVPGSTGGTGALININTADEATLETLNGVGPVLAAAIVQYRTEHGPFASVDQLDEVSGIGPATLEDLRSQVTV